MPPDPRNMPSGPAGHARMARMEDNPYQAPVDTACQVKTRPAKLAMVCIGAVAVFSRGHCGSDRRPVYCRRTRRQELLTDDVSTDDVSEAN